MSTPNLRDRDGLLEAIGSADDKRMKEFVKGLYASFLTPSFGSLPKKEIELLLFNGLKQMSILPEDFNSYDLSAAFRISKPRAANLIYNADLRWKEQDSIEKEIRMLLQAPIALPEDAKGRVKLQIENLRLKDEIRWVLHDKKYLTDSSFSADILDVSIDGFKYLISYYYPGLGNKNAKSLLKESGVQASLDAKEVLREVLKTAASKVAGKAGEKVSTILVDELFKIIFSISGKTE